MKLYRTVYPDPNQPDADPAIDAVAWHSSNAEASAFRTATAKDNNMKRTEFKSEQIDVPTDKIGLLEFLNTHATIALSEDQ